MIYNLKKIIVLGLGGSIICPDEINVKFLKGFKQIIERWLKKGRKFIIVVGGGKLSRKYQEATEKIYTTSDIDKDRIGIQATRLNAQLIRSIFGKNADLTVVSGRDFIGKKLHYPITVACGWIPGRSTDFVAVQIAADFKISEVVTMGKPDYVYPVKNNLHTLHSKITHDEYLDKIHPFTEIKWREYRKLVPKNWSPGAHAPVDTVASELAEKTKINVLVIGKSLSNLNNLLKGSNFRGTVIGNV